MTNNDKELCLQAKHSCREIKEALNFEEMESFEEIERKREKIKKIKVNRVVYFALISVVPLITTILLIVIDSNKNAINAMGILVHILTGLSLEVTEWFFSALCQRKFLINKACKLSYEKMQYIPLTKNELASLNIHNVNDYVHFLNDFLTSEIIYFSYSQFKILTIRQIARPPQQLLNEINRSLSVYLDKTPDKLIRFNNVFKIFEVE